MSQVEENTNLLIVEPERSKALTFVKIAKDNKIKAQWACNLKVAEMLLRGCRYNFVLIDVDLDDSLREALTSSYINVEISREKIIFVKENIFLDYKNVNKFLKLVKLLRENVGFGYCDSTKKAMRKVEDNNTFLRDAVIDHEKIFIEGYDPTYSQVIKRPRMQNNIEMSYSRSNSFRHVNSRLINQDQYTKNPPYSKQCPQTVFQKGHQKKYTNTNNNVTPDTYNNYRIDSFHKMLIVSGNIIKLTNLEYDLILRIVNGEATILNNSERVLLSRLKKKISKISGMSIIKNRYGQGYYWGLD